MGHRTVEPTKELAALKYALTKETSFLVSVKKHHIIEGTTRMTQPRLIRDRFIVDINDITLIHKMTLSGLFFTKAGCGYIG